MEWMQALPTRPWDIDGRISGYTFARLLMPFEIRPRLQRMGPENTARGYQLEDFLKAGRKHLGLNLVQTPAGVVSDTRLLNPESFDANAKSLVPPIGTNSIPNGFLPLTSDQKSPVTDNHQSEIANKDRLCNTVAHAGAISLSASKQQPKKSPPQSVILRGVREAYTRKDLALPVDSQH